MSSVDQFIGVSGPEFEFPLELGKQREFAAAVHAFHKEFHEGPNPIIFPTLPIIAGYLWGYMLEEPRGTSLEALHMNEALSLDGEQEFIFHGPLPRVGDTLMARAYVDKIWVKQGKRGGKLRFYRMACEYKHAVTGDLRLTLYSTSVVPEDVPENTPASTQATSSAFLPYKEERLQFMDMPRVSPDDVSLGDSPGPVRMPPHTLTDCVRYQITTGSYGPAHHDINAAHSEGFPTWFGVGMYHAGLLCTYAVAWLGAENLRRYKARFIDVSWPGDILIYSGKVTEVFDQDGARTVRLHLSAARDDGTIVTQAEADFAPAASL